MRKAVLFVLCIVISATSFANEALTKIKHIEGLKQELFALSDDEEHWDEREKLRNEIDKEIYILQTDEFIVNSNEECFSFELSKDSFSASLAFDSEEVFHCENSISSIEANLTKSAQISFSVHIKENRPSEYEIMIWKITLLNQKGKTCSQKAINESRTFTFNPITDVDWENHEINQKNSAAFRNHETSSTDEIDFQKSEQIDWSLKDERTTDINFAYNCYWNGNGWQCASLSLSVERSIYDKYFFFGGNFEAGSDNALVPLAWIAWVFDKVQKDDPNSTEKDKKWFETLLSSDYKVFITATARAGLMFPFFKSKIFRIFAETGSINNSSGTGGGASMIFYKYSSPGGYLAMNLEYSIFHTYKVPVSQKANIGIRIAF